MKQAIRQLMITLNQSVGPKVYLRDVKQLLGKLENVEVSPQERQALSYLARDLESLKTDNDRQRNLNKRMGFRF